MKCPRCEHENPSKAKFCLECGVHLALTCAQCGAELPADAKFCLQCGRQVSAPSTEQSRFTSPEAYTPKHLAEKILTSKTALEGERKQVTVLFADLKGSMELLADRDPEEARKLLDPVLEHMMEAVHRYEGTVNQVMGDGIMALFGAPLAHEDHAVRACYAALRMQESIRRYTEDVRRSHGIALQIRVGLNSGEVVVRAIGNDLHMDYTAVGQTTHLAARMEQLATPGSNLLTAETLRLAEGFVQVKPLGPIPVKGMEAPIEVYEMIGAGPVRRRLEAAAARGLTRFVGRQTEQEAIHHSLEQARTGQGQVVALIGEPGVGKSRLFWEFTHSHRTHGWLILESSSVSYGKATAYLPVIDLLRSYFQVEDRDDQRKIREKVTGKLLTLDKALEPTLPAFLTLLDVPVEDSQWQALEPPQRRRQTLDAVKRLLLKESQVQPLCLVFEDLHWIDSETQAFLDNLIESLPTARLLLLVNYRPEYQHGWSSKTFYTQLRIDPLPPASAEELLQALLGDSAELAPLKQLLINRTEGNPFFLEESVRTLEETQVLVGERGAYQLAKPLESIRVPATVQAVLASRIDRIPPEEKVLLQTAAVLGKDVQFALLRAIAEETEENLRRSLTRLQAAEFLYETQLFPELEYTFKHALTHEVAYNSLLVERRHALHARIVEAIERLYPDRLSEQVERLAHHAFRGERWAKAMSYHLSAAEKVKERYAYTSAASFCKHALEAAAKAPDVGEERVRGLALLGDVRSLMGDLERANESYEQALEVSTDTAVRRWIANKIHRPHSVVRDGAKIVFYEHGSGNDTLVMTNPLLQGLATFQPVVERLCQEFRIITIDSRGTGSSDPLRRPYTLKDHMEDVRAVIEALAAAPVVGVGISRGGRIVVRLVDTYPSLIHKIVLIGANSGTGRRATADEVRANLGQGNIEGALSLFSSRIFSEPETHDLAEQLLGSLLSQPLETILGFFLDPDPEAKIDLLLPKIRVPTLVVHGTADRTVPFEAGRYLAEHIPGAHLYAFKERGHLPIFTATKEFCEILSCFVRTGRVPESAGPFLNPSPPFSNKKTTAR